jgi:hypothetical protein
MMAVALFSEHFYLPVLAVLAVALWLLRDRMAGRGPLAIMLLFNALFILASAFIRMKPYYAIFLQVAACLLLASLAGPRDGPGASFRDYLRSVAPLAALLVLYTAFALDLKTHWEDIYIQSAGLMDDIRVPLDRVKQENGDAVVVNMSNDRGLAVYYFFAQPYASMDNQFNPKRATLPCGATEEMAFYCRDTGSARAIYALSQGTVLHEKWEEAAVAKLGKILEKRPVHVLYNRRYPNEDLRRHLVGHCEQKDAGRMYEFYHCPKSAPAP